MRTLKIVTGVIMIALLHPAVLWMSDLVCQHGEENMTPVLSELYTGQTYGRRRQHIQFAIVSH